MPWKVHVHSQPPVVETWYGGVMDGVELGQAIHETIREAQTHDTRLFLGDCTALQGGHSITDLFMVLENLRANGLTGTIREAVLLPQLPDQVEKVKFWETAAANRGLVIELFTDRAQAMSWLQNQTPGL